VGGWGENKGFEDCEASFAAGAAAVLVEEKMKRASAGKPAADWLWCLGRARGTQTLLVLITLCIVFITVQVPQFIGPSILPQINAPLDAIEEGLIAGLGRSRYHHHHQEQFQNTEPHQQQQQQRKLIANEWNEKPGQSSSDGDDHLLPGSAPSKHKTASQVSEFACAFLIFNLHLWKKAFCISMGILSQ